MRDRVDEYYPLYWLRNDDRAAYEELFGIRHSDCYERWGFTRTGCVGCPFNRRLFDDLDVVEQNEPRMAKAAKRIFADAYEYTRMYRDFRSEMRNLEHGQARLPGLAE